MMHQSGRGTTPRECHLQRRHGQPGFQRGIQRPANRPPRKRVQHHRQVHELFQQPDVGDIGPPELVDPAPPQRRRQVRIHFQPVGGVGRRYKLTSADSAPVKSRSTDSRQRAHPADREWSSGFHFALDLVVNGAPPFAARSGRCCSTCCKARFKKSISSTCCPILRSNSAIRVSSARFWPTPGNARSPNLSTSRLQRYSSWRLTSRLRATKPAGSPARNRCTASSLNSLVNFLRD